MQRVVIMDLPIKDDGTFKNSKAKSDLQERINHNSVLFNMIVRDGSKVVVPGPNLITYANRGIFKKTYPEKMQLKRMKKNWKKGILSETGFLEPATKADIIRAFVKHEVPDWNIKFQIIKN